MQEAGGSNSAGGLPGMVSKRLPLAPPPGMERMRARLYGWRALRSSSLVSPVSTTLPAYMTEVRWQVSATTPKLWVMSRMLMPMS